MTVCRHKFEGIFDMHGVKIGSPEEIPRFLEKLRTDRYFAMDFWALVSSLEGWSDRITEAEIRRTVVDCVCGEWVPADDPIFLEIERAFKSRVCDAFQTGKPWQQDPLDVERRAAVPAPPLGPDPAAAPMVFELADAGVMENEGGLSSPEHDGGVVELGSSFPESSSHRMDLALSRLELNSYELKLHLDSIDSRMSRLEPHLEELVLQVVKSLGLGAAEDERARSGFAVAAQGELAEPRGEMSSGDGLEVLPTVPSVLPEAPEAPEASKAEESSEASEAEEDSGPSEASPPVLATLSMAGRRSWVPSVLSEASKAEESSEASEAEEGSEPSEASPPLLATLSMAGRRPWAVLRGDSSRLAGVVAALLAVGLCLWLAVWLWGQRAQETVTAVAPVAAGAVQSSGPAKVAAGTPGVDAGGERARRRAAGTVRSARPDTDAEVGENGIAPPSTRWYDGSHPASGGAGGTGDGASAGASRDSAGGAVAGVSSGDRVSRGDATGRGAGPARVALARSAVAGSATGAVESGMRQVRVSSGLMASNLLESSAPDYPKLARLTGLQGPVVLDVVISDRGTVDHVDVVKGHRLLRGAAESAVKHWRYRPYLLDGRPVEVATTVTVDFKLDR
jgi:TonB family protein